ncbi:MULTISPECIES: hypothetical protein [unclassified Streptomyces]|nr:MULTISPECIES: hypothetical protein [unclassified Streptomyces]
MNGGNGGDLTPDPDRNTDRNVDLDTDLDGAHGTARWGGAE